MLPWIRSDKRNYKKVIKTVIGLFLVTFFVFSLASVVSAQGDTFGVNKVGSLLPLGGEDIRVIAAKIVRIVLSLLGVVALGIILYAGFTWMTSGGNEDKIATAKKTLINGVIGMTIIMASFAIVQFVLSALSDATGSGNVPGGGGRGISFDSYYASGSLGRIIKDHYPLRDQKNVPRNTRIAVTFREAIDPASIIKNTNGNDKIGDCIHTDDPGFDWGPNFCDQLSTSSIKINITGATSTPAIESAALVTLEGVNQDAYTFMFRPLSLLGSAQFVTDYTVTLTGNILKKDGQTSAFVGDRHGQYVWNFQTDTTIDVIPPHITSVYPDATSTAPRNSLIQINFNEPVDPTMAQGLSGPNSPFSNIIFHDGSITGAWRISNGYKTVEFTSDIPCGQNSCGEVMYCLPVNCQGNAACPANPYGVLVRTALTLAQNSFEAVPFSGVMDMAGNALDNGPANNADGQMANPHRPGFVQGEPKILHDGEKAPDNYYWGFLVSNSIDRSAPNIETVTPNLDAESVPQTAPLVIHFNKRLSTLSLDAIAIEEFPSPATLQAQVPIFKTLGDIWFRPDTVSVDNKSVMTLQHREFGPQGTSFYYFPVIPSSVRSLTQNCLYPGRGPWVDAQPNGPSSPVCDYSENENGVADRSLNCVRFPNNFTSSTDTGCVQYTNENVGVISSNTTTCVNTLKDPQISAPQQVIPN